jgi:cytochrome P450
MLLYRTSAFIHFATILVQRAGQLPGYHGQPTNFQESSTSQHTNYTRNTAMWYELHRTSYLLVIPRPGKISTLHGQGRSLCTKMVCLMPPDTNLNAHKLLERSLAAIRRPEDADTILTVIDNRDHARIRRVLANAFSTKALTDQEYYIQHYISMFIDSLHSIHQTGPVNMVAWLEFVTFDIVGMLTVRLTVRLPAKP